MGGPNAEKGARYLTQLDQALCTGTWSEIQELARKTDKHAPERRCFALAARSEAQIASASHRPTSAGSSASSSMHSLGDLIPKLQEAIAAADAQFPDDAYAARVCLAEIQWLRHEYSAAMEVLRPELSKPRGSHSGSLKWINVCGVKAQFISASSAEASGNMGDAWRQYDLAGGMAPGPRDIELKTWTERLVARGLIVAKTRSEPTAESLSDLLDGFKDWSEDWSEFSPPAGAAASSHLFIPRREVWKAYYEVVSTALQYRLAYGSRSDTHKGVDLVPSYTLIGQDRISSKLKQRADLKRVEAKYESHILNETRFPKANQDNKEIEQWVEQVITNWKVLAGSDWTDQELGEGGKEALGRGVLEILYRAATKTFHSTPILRHLVTVHAGLGEFDLALHAFNSYIEIVSKGKARAQKTGKPDVALDNDDMIIMTAVDAIRVLCRYGDFKQAEKALEVRQTLRECLQLDKKEGASIVSFQLQPETTAAAHRAMGVSKAHWARLTYDTEARSTIRADALSSLEIAREHHRDDPETSYALAALLAESRDVDAAIGVIRQAISASNTLNDSEDEDEVDGFQKRRQLIPFWHLLALCLTAKDDYEQAAKMCDAAFEQFGDAEALYGQHSNHLSLESERASGSADGVVGQMDAYERASLLHVKMTQLASLELTEGAEHAVGTSHELLALYARLFGNPERLRPAAPRPATVASAVPPKTGGTLRSIAGSIRPGSKRSSHEKTTYKHSSLLSVPQNRNTAANVAGGAANGSQPGAPIAITVTNEEGVNTEKSHSHRLPFKLRGHHGDWREHGNLKSTTSLNNLDEKTSPSLDGPEVPPKDTEESASKPNGNGNAAAAITSAVARNSIEDEKGPEQPLNAIQHNGPSDVWPAPVGHDEQPPRQDVRLPTRLPASNAPPSIRLGSVQSRRHKISLVVEVWLFIAGLYLRAELLDDASGAVMEAHKFVDQLVVEAAGENMNARRLFHRGWGGGKSVDYLWADVWAAKGQLALARDQPWRALEAFEQTVAYFPDHPGGIIGLSNVLMDIYEEKLPVEEPIIPLREQQPGYVPIPPRPFLIQLPPSTAEPPKPEPSKFRRRDPTPAEVNRLANRDRAYMLLNTLTRLGSGWDNSEAWYTLARAHELSGQIEKAKKALWWVVELEENKPIRPWSEVSAGGFTL